jgi:molybdopterin converting factor small subunit
VSVAAPRSRVHVPTLLQSYTKAAEVEGQGATLDAVLRDLDARYPGLRFRIIDEQERIRPHIRLFIDGRQAGNLAAALPAGAELMIVGALSGG